MLKINFVPIFFCWVLVLLSSSYTYFNSTMPNPDPDPDFVPFVPMNFPAITVASLNCNSLNMSTVTKHTRIRKFYGIVSLKTDVIFLSDMRMCNKAELTDMKYIIDTFAVNPHCSYIFSTILPQIAGGSVFLSKNH